MTAARAAVIMGLWIRPAKGISETSPLAASATISAFAGSAEQDGSDFVVTAGAGESFTNGTAIGNYARLRVGIDCGRR